MSDARESHKGSANAEEEVEADDIITSMNKTFTRCKIEICPDKTKMSLVVRKPVFGVSDLVRHKPGCTVTEDG